MAPFTASDFLELCRHGPVEEQIRTIEANRRSAVRKFWLYGLCGLALSVLLGLLAGATAGETVGILVFIVLLVATIAAALGPLSAAREGIKHPVLEALAGQSGMTFLPAGFDPPVFDEARRPLFGSWLSDAQFSDLFHGKDEDGLNFAFYEATLSRGRGKHRHQVFSGQIYAFQRRRPQQGASVAVPDKGLFNFFKPAGGFERVKFEHDPAFEKKFEVYGERPQEAALLFGSLAARTLLLDLRKSGRTFAYVGPSDVLVAVTGKNRFEPGSMFRARGGEERVRMMFDDVCAALDVLKRLRASFG
ncbi:MAG: DUF3137 domain-containing protein [Pseudomonadota bacterium]|nr:DUF3137 domain-containing protein [Pseudomonadota bacterium]